MEMPVLWHIPLSHYNEKVRWALDHKRIVHRRQVLGPNYLFRAWRATRRGTLPILWLDGRAIGDSTRIIAALEERYPEPPLYPADAAARERALALEDYFDEQLGPALRAAVATPLFRHDPDLALRVLTTGMPDKAYQRLRPLVRIFPAFYRFRHKIKDARLDADRASANGKGAIIWSPMHSRWPTSRPRRCFRRYCDRRRSSTQCASSCRHMCRT